MADLETQAAQRKDRLNALKAKKSSKDSSENNASKPVLKFRSYNPQTEGLRERKLPKARPEEVQEQIAEQLETGRESSTIEGVSLANLAPRKVDWDLKRDVAKKLERLERRTQRAIVEIIRERLSTEESGDLASAVQSAEAEAGGGYDSD